MLCPYGLRVKVCIGSLMPPTEIWQATKVVQARVCRSGGIKLKTHKNVIILQKYYEIIFYYGIGFVCVLNYQGYMLYI